MTNLERLLLDVTYVPDSGLAHLRGLKKLRVLTLDATRVTDSGLKYLEDLTSLEVLVLPHPNRVTDVGLDRLRQALPNCRINE